MDSATFLEELHEILQREDPLTPDTALRDMEEWDSLAVMACMAWLGGKFGVKTRFSQYKKLRNVDDLMRLAGVNRE
jgi:acyl carrier protein